MNQTAEAAKEASRQLAGFDELDILKDDSSEDEGEKLSPGEMFEEVPIDEETRDLADKMTEEFADKIKDALDDGDFTDIGRVIGEKLRDALQRIPWDQIKEAAYKLGKSLATLLNGILETPGLFYELGRTLAKAINTAFSFLDGFVWNFHWDSLGNALMDMIEGACDNLDWTTIQHFVGTAVTVAISISKQGWTTIQNFVGTAVTTAITLTRNGWSSLASWVGNTLSVAISLIKSGWATISSFIGTTVTTYYFIPCKTKV